MTPAEVLRAAADKLEGGHWTQHLTARNSEGVGVKALSAEAVCWCAMGALQAAGDDYSGYGYSPVGRALFNYVGRALPAWNDSPRCTEATVVAAMRATADRLEGAL